MNVETSAQCLGSSRDNTMDDKKVMDFMELAETLVKDLKTTKAQNHDSQRRFQKTEEDLLSQIEALRSQLEACTSELKDTQEGLQKTTAELEKTRAELESLKQNDAALQETRKSLRESNAGLTDARAALEQKESELEDMRLLVEQMAAENEQMRQTQANIQAMLMNTPQPAAPAKVSVKRARSPSVEIVAVRTISSKESTSSLKRAQSAKEPSPSEFKRRKTELMLKKEPEVDKVSAHIKTKTTAPATPQKYILSATPAIQASTTSDSCSTSAGLNASKPHINAPYTSTTIVTTQPVASTSTNQAPATQPVISARMRSSQSKATPDAPVSPSPKIIIPPRASPIKRESKATELKLAASIVSKHLSSCQQLAISPAPTAPEVSRRFLTATYGGNPQSFINVLKKNPTGPGTRRIVFPMLDCNPFVPLNPGEPGLIFASRHEILSDPPWTVFVKRTNAAPAVWSYQGEYECTLCGTMTVEEFTSQTQKVQDRWAQEVHDAKTYDVYVIMRARVALRKAGLIPLQDKAKENALIEEEMGNIKRSKGRPVTMGEILSAFHKGEEAIDIIRMNCVKYDHVFADDMKVQYESYQVSGKSSASSTSAVKKKKPRSATVPVPPPSKSRSSGTGEGGEYSRATAPIPTTHSDMSSSDPDAGLRRSNRPRSTRIVSPDGLSEFEFSDMDYDEYL